MNVLEYRDFVFNKGRDLEVSLFNHLLLNDTYDNCLLALSLYVNEDGGISNIDPNNLNNISTLSACLYFLDIVNKINYNNEEEYFNEFINDLIKYLMKQKEFGYFHKSNIKKPCSNLFKEDKYYLELEALTYAYIYKYTNHKLYKEKLNKLINLFINKTNITFNELLYFKKVENLINNDLLKEKIIDTTKLFILDNNLYKLVFSSDDYLLKEYKEQFINNKNYLINSKTEVGLWEIPSNWSDEYPEGEVAMIKCLSITLIDVLSFFKYMEVF